MQSVSSRIWTRGAVSISYNDNHYTTAPLTQDAPFLSSKIHPSYGEEEVNQCFSKVYRKSETLTACPDIKLRLLSSFSKMPRTSSLFLIDVE